MYTVVSTTLCAQNSGEIMEIIALLKAKFHTSPDKFPSKSVMSHQVNTSQIDKTLTNSLYAPKIVNAVANSMHAPQIVNTVVNSKYAPEIVNTVGN